MPVEVYLGRGLPGSLDCMVDANPPASQVVWTKNERPLNVVSLPRVFVDRQGSLVFRSVSHADEGRYTCAAYSSLGAGRSSTTVRVYVRGMFMSLTVRFTTDMAILFFFVVSICLY